MDLLSSAVLTLLSLVTAIAVVYLLICVDPNSPGPLGLVRKLIIEDLPLRFNAAGKAIFGPKFEEAVGLCCGLFFNMKNPIVMIIYFIIGPGGYLLYLKYGYWNHMPNEYVSSIHLYPSLVVAGFGFYCYYKAVVVDPGTITLNNIDEYLQKYNNYDGLMYKPDQECRTCHFMKPARSKHSTVTNCCIARFDHYCIWIRGDVGERNYKYFLGFIMGHALLTAYGFFFGHAVLRGIIDRQSLWDVDVYDSDT